eukprot:CAMPEP_0182419984 /NCGR_PEP_ID=MMETSP1167-20130531/4444_1 /TAXON_ID=2988 /ORGANISM="Mallomonas Sp, Strain CCMP3275" /LENGTH=351 /DNA_ID=CAMNT_0024595307 /DNA_START=154 /DNA_END=1209 /DNA_ORIENTATION=-
MTKMITIAISGSRDLRLRDPHIECLVDALKKSLLTPLKHLILKNHRIGDVGFQKLTEIITLTDDTGLETLNIEGNDITDKNLYLLQDVLENSDTHSCFLEELNLSCNPIGPHGGMSLAAAMERNTSIRHLFLANCEFNLRAVISIAVALSLHKYIQTLILDRPLLSTLEDEGSNHIARMLARQPSLLSLSLRFHQIGDNATRLLSQSLFQNETLTSLNLEGNKICVGGANALARNLITDMRLRELKLSSNILGDEGARAIAEALKTNTSLHRLTLKHNNIKVSGLNSLCTALDSNNTLQYITLWGNNFTHESGGMYYDLCRLRCPYTGLLIDIEVYIVDEVYMVAEKDIGY